MYSGREGLVSIRWDGTDEKTHLKVTGITTYGSVFENNCMLVETEMEPRQEPSNAAVVTMAPEGDYALAQINNDIYVVTVPKIGKVAPKISVSDPDKAQFPARKLTKIGGQFAVWNNTGKVVYYSIGNAFFTYNIEDAKTKEEEIKKKKAEEKEKKSEGDKKEEEKKDEKKDEGYEPAEIRIKVSVPRDTPQGKVLLQGARIITMKGDEVFESGDILIENNRIRQVGNSGSISVDGNVKKIDVKGKTIVPGFLWIHMHICGQRGDCIRMKHGYTLLTWRTV